MVPKIKVKILALKSIARSKISPQEELKNRVLTENKSHQQH
uniref:Ribosome biogenesis protein WDR12 like n=1 Tax=Rhizophora mucronata TaxID=61149 RepID=A0A2P2KPV7_RHIMU